MKFKPGKYRTRSGLEVEILSNSHTMANGNTLIGVINRGSGWNAMTWCEDGKTHVNAWEEDLVHPDEYVEVVVHSKGRHDSYRQCALDEGANSYAADLFYGVGHDLHLTYRVHKDTGDATLILVKDVRTGTCLSAVQP